MNIRVLYIFIQLICLLPACAFAESKNVLLVNSYDQEMNWVSSITQGVIDTLQPDQVNLHLHIENMSSKMFSSKEYYQAFSKMLEAKYQNISFSVILTSDNNAYDFFRERRDLLFPGVPVVFCGVNDFQQEQLEGLEKFTGFAESITIRETVDLILRNHPETKEIFIINDYLVTGKAWRRSIKKELKNYPAEVMFRYSENKTLQDLQDEIAGLSPGTVIVLGVFFSDKDGYSSSYEEIGRDLAKVSPVPIYCLAEFNLSEYIIGGVVVSGYGEGEEIARIARKILDGQPAYLRPVRGTNGHRAIFDYRQLKKWNIKETKLPPGAVVQSRPFSLYTAYKMPIWMGLLFIFVLLCTIVFLGINVRRRKVTEIILQRSREKFRKMYQDAPVMLYNVDQNNRIFQVNDLWLSIMGYARQEVVGRQILDFMTPDSKEKMKKDRSILYSAGYMHDCAHTLVRKNGEIIEVLLTAYLEKNSHGETIGVRVSMIDVTLQNKLYKANLDLEKQVQQSQKLESIGRLAGGIAHDLNNLLSPILGYGGLLKADSSLTEEQKKRLDQIFKAAVGARDLVKQLLAFSRKQAVEVKALNMNDNLQECLKLLRQTIPENIKISCKMSEDLKPILADDGQIKQVIVNLLVNAADSMKDRGEIVVETANESLDQEYCKAHRGARPGDYVLLSVEDNGCGIEPDAISQIFEPFYSTKGDLGTGLGLSIVYGVVKQHCGYVQVDSEPGHGTTFRIYLPVTEKVRKTVKTVSSQERERPGGETIMLVEDNHDVRNICKTMLEELGYTVFSFSDGTSAQAAGLELYKMVDLLITDVIMPDINGKELYQRLSKLLSQPKVLYMSGYTDDIIAKHGIIEEGVLFIEKPFTKEGLAKKVRIALDTLPDL